MGEATPIDDRGRFTIAPQYRAKLGKRIVQIWTPHGLLLRPISGKVPKGTWPPAAAASGEAAALRDARERRARVE